MVSTRHILEKNRIHRVGLVSLGSIITIGLIILYLFAFFSYGTNFDGAFLEKEVVSSETHYKGRNEWGNIHITVKSLKENSIGVIYSLPNNIDKQFVVDFDDSDDIGSEDALANRLMQSVKIRDNSGQLLFEGEYSKDQFFLFDINGKPLLEGIGDIYISSQNPYENSYNISFRNVVSFAAFENDVIRGDVKLLVLAILLFILLAVDIKFPLFFFKLRHGLSVEDPEPSDLFLAIQRISWYIYPIIAVIMLIAAIL